MGEAVISRTLENSDVEVVQETGTSTSDLMSQKSVTDELNKKVDKVEGEELSTKDFTAEDKEKLDSSVSRTRMINSEQLTDDIVLTPDGTGALPISFSDHTHSASSITSGTLFVSRDGTGAGISEAERSNLSVYSKSEVDSKISASNLVNLLCPVGSIYLSVNSTNPKNLFGGTWEQIKNRFLLSAGSSYSAGATGGESTHKLTTSEMPSHSHKTNKSSEQRWSAEDRYRASFRCGRSSDTGGDIYTDATGSSKAHNNMPPYIVVYMWKRTA